METAANNENSEKLKVITHLPSSSEIISTPDLERILLNANLPQLPHLGPEFFPVEPTPVTSEQEAFGKGFDEALRNLHQTNNNSQNKEVNQTVIAPTSSDKIPKKTTEEMSYLEKSRLEYKRHQNRLAATRCRERKLQRIVDLEDMKNFLSNEITKLGMEVHQRTESVAQLKEEVISHINQGCDILSLQSNSFVSN